MTTPPELAVVLVNYNNEDDTIDCLNSLLDQTLRDFLTVVVDNSSNQDSLKKITSQFDTPTFLRNDSNRGFTGGNNPGIEYALEEGAKWILLLNNDTVLEPSFLEDFLLVANDQPDDVGILGPKIHTHESNNIWSAGGTLNRWTASTGSLHEFDQTVSDFKSVDQVAGAALLVRDDVFHNIGLLDEDFFIYYEETEFCARARNAGWDVVYAPVDGVYHKETTSHSYSPFGEYYLVRNRLLFQQKTQPAHVRSVFYPYYVLRWILLQPIFLLLIENNIPAAEATFRGGIDALAGRFGKRHAERLRYN